MAPMQTPAPVPPGLPLRPPTELPPPTRLPPPPETRLVPAPPAPTPPRKRWPFVLVTAGVALFAALGGVIIGAALTDDDPPQVAAPVVIDRPSDQVAGGPLDVGEIVAKVQPSVVNITADGADGIAVGTGVILTTDGEVLTNAHVVGDADTVHVRLVGETEPRTATVLGRDPRNDLALLRINGASGLVPIELATGTIQVGDDVVAVGYALDLDGGPSVTKGIVSGLDRTLPSDDDVLDGLIQTDAAISSGNSGGPLVNNRGQLVGINTAVVRGGVDFAANNIGFAISLDEALPTVEALRSGAPLTPLPFLGVKIEDRVDGGEGALITEVVEGAPADAAGMQVGDVVLGVDGRAVTGADGLIAAIRDAAPGDTLTLDVERGGTRVTVQATLRERTDED
jgi:putative serine protease PepD